MLSIIQRSTGCPPCAMRLSSTSFMSSLVGGTHVLETLTERDDGEAHALEVLHHLDGSPPVECDLADVEALA
jgi:hypothetical protein